MTTTDDRQFPVPLAAALAVPFEFEDGEGVDFEPLEEFLSAEETTDWWRSWTDNPELTGDAFRVFGGDASGSHAAFWLVREGAELAAQPVVLLGSEGETAVVARNLGDFLWLLADGSGPVEAASPYHDTRPSRPHPALTGIAERHAPGGRHSAVELVRAAAEEFPDFEETVLGLCR